MKLKIEIHWHYPEDTSTGKRYTLYAGQLDSDCSEVTKYYIDMATHKPHYSNGKKYGIYVKTGKGKYGYYNWKKAKCIGGYSKLKEAKKIAEEMFKKEYESIYTIYV